MSITEIPLAFIEGLALIASPCILPVLPLVLAASSDGGKKRPFGVIVGFVLAFTVFALVSRQIVTTLGIDPGVIRNVSLVLLFAFGIVLFSEKLSRKFSELTQSIANIGSTLPGKKGEDFLSGVSLGALIGLVWTPCAGPILATVIVQVLRQQTDYSSYGVIFAFSLGAAVPMFIIAMTGRTVFNKFAHLTNHTEALRKCFGALILLSVVFIASGFDINKLLPADKPHMQAPVDAIEDGVVPYPAHAVTGIDTWLNSPPLTNNDFKGKVVLIDFWTYSCINCVRTLPYLTAWDEKYRDKGLLIIGIHTPEFEFEKNADNVKDALMAHGIKYPVALDNHLATWTSFDNKFWPAHYLIDRSGNVVYTHFGEGKYDVTENNIRYLLGLEGQVTKVDSSEKKPHQTPETYLGSARAKNFAGDSFKQDEDQDFDVPENLPLDHWALSGTWNMGKEKITAQETDAAITLHFTAKKVFLVLGNAKRPVSVSITLNGKPTMNKLTIDQHSLYEIVSQDEAKEGVVEIKANQPGLEAYAFTFGG